MKYLWIVLLATLLVFGCSENNREADWTILVYMAADNGLNNAALSDINEMENAQFSNDINVIVQIDNSDYLDPSSAFRYKIKPDHSSNITSPQIASLGEIDSGDPAVLSEFANWGFREYPSLNKALVIWSHGNGWYNLASQFCPDAESGSSISLPDGDLRNALDQINFNMDILLLDACNMQTIEVLAEAIPYTDYLIASEEAVLSDGFPYDDILNSWENHSSSEAIASNITHLFYESYLPGGSQNNSNIYLSTSCSSVKSSQFPALIALWEQFVVDWTFAAGESYFREARTEAYPFNDLESDVDIQEYLQILLDQDIPDQLNSDINALLLQIDKTFISSSFIDYPTDNIGTAVIWFPDEEVLFNNLRSQYELLNFAETGWCEFLETTFVD